MQHHQPLPQQLQLTLVRYFNGIMVEGEEAEGKEYWYVELCSSLQIQITLVLDFVLICWDLLIFILLTFPFLVPLHARYHLISEFFTNISTRWALPFSLRYMFYFNKLYWIFIDREVNQPKRECVLVCFLPNLLSFQAGFFFQLCCLTLAAIFWELTSLCIVQVIITFTICITVSVPVCKTPSLFLLNTGLMYCSSLWLLRC